MEVNEWTIQGVEGLAILGNTHMPNEDPRGVIVIAHGFKGYKDYGMFPCIAQEAANAGLIAHRFNFSHSGMTNNTDTFEQPELFERDTWNKQVDDLRSVITAIESDGIAGAGLPIVLFGHSRGGVSVLLFAGRTADDASIPKPAGVVTAAAPDRCNNLTKDEQRLLLEQGYLESPSNRTGQTLRVGKAFLQEQIDQPAQYDLLAIVSCIRCPVLAIHGSDDPTVPAECAAALERAASNSRTVVIDGADHVFNTPNPMRPDSEPSVQLRQLIDTALDFARTSCGMQV